MSRKLRIAIVGPGRLGTALALELKRAGFVIDEVISRSRSPALRQALSKRLNAPVVSLQDARLAADVIWICVPDSEIAPVAKAVARRVDGIGKIAFHSSGALASDELKPLRARGATAASVHPMMTFVRGSRPSLQGVPFAVEGDSSAARLARRIVRNLGGEAISIRQQDKAAYHAWGAFASPLLLATLVTAEQVGAAAGLSAAGARKKMLPILHQTVENYARLGPAAAFSGPIVRGDTEIVRRHLRTLRQVPQAREVYRALARAALRYLPARNRKQLRKILGAANY